MTHYRYDVIFYLEKTEIKKNYLDVLYNWSKSNMSFDK